MANLNSTMSLEIERKLKACYYHGQRALFHLFTNEGNAILQGEAGQIFEADDIANVRFIVAKEEFDEYFAPHENG